MTIAERLEQAKEIYQLLFENKGQNASDGSSVEHYLMKIIGSLSEADKANEQGRDVNTHAYENKNHKEAYKAWQKQHKEAHSSFSKIAYEEHILGTQQDKLADVYIGLMGLAMKIKEDYNVSDEKMIKPSGVGVDTRCDVSKRALFSEICYALTKSLINHLHYLNLHYMPVELFHYSQQIGDLFAFDLDWHVAEKMKYLQATKS